MCIRDSSPDLHRPNKTAAIADIPDEVINPNLEFSNKFILLANMSELGCFSRA